MVRKLLRSVNRKLSDLDIQRKVILLYLLCALIPLTTADCLVVGLVVTNARKSQTELLKNTAQSVEYILNSHVEDACALARSIFLNRRINQFLDTRFSSDLDYYVQRTELLDTFLQEAFLGTSSAVVTIYSDNETMLNGGVFWNLSCPEARKWLPELTSDQGQQLLMYFDDTKTRNFREERKISVVWELDYFSSQETISYVKIDLDYEKLLQELSVTTFGCEVYVCDGAGRILLASDGSAGRSEDFSHISPAGLGVDAYIRQIRLVEEPLTVYVVPYGCNFLDPVPAQTTALMALMIAITAALLLILRWTVRKNVVDRLSVVTDSFHIDSEGTLRQIPEDAVEGCDEIATLMRDYNAMANRQNRLVETVYKSRLKQQEANIARQEAELLALHSQINPHFLFNVLENIRMRSVVKKEMETAEMIELLAMMERQYVDWSTDMLTIREEKAFVEAYLRLQKYRLGNKLSYAIDMEDHRCDGMKIPKLSILTFVENACVHGAENKAGQCWIFVRAYLEGEDLVIVIEDTGGGMPEDAVRELREKMENASIDMLKGKGRVGIVNACLRLKMQSQGHVRFSLESEEGVGTMIVITSPAGYYDMEGNIRHDVLMRLFEKYVTNEHALWLLKKAIDRSKVDVSYMTDDEYENCLDRLFNSLLYQHIDKSLLTGEKFMAKHLNIGDQVAQTAGISYPIPIDNYIKIVKGVKEYGRYMDDSYVIHESKGFLQELLVDIIEKAKEIGITVNTRKTRICKLSEYWRFLQVQYSLTETGRVIQKINPKRLTAMRRKMKKLAHKLNEKEFIDWYMSWFKNHYKIMSKRQRSNIETLFK